MKRKIYLRLQAYDKKDIQSFEKNLVDYLENYRITRDTSSISLPMEKKKITLLRSPHANKKAKDQFEIRLYNKVYIINVFGNVNIFSNFFPSNNKLSLKITESHQKKISNK